MKSVLTLRTPCVLGALAIALAIAAPTTVPVAAAQEQPRQPGFGPGRCGPIDSGYTEAAKATGGQVFTFSPSELAIAAPLFADVAMAGDKPLLLALEPTAAGVASPVSFAVDRSVRRLIIHALFDGKGGTLDLLSPDNAAVEASERVKDARLACSRMLTVERPDPGVWRGNAVPTERFWLRVFAETDFDLASAEFVDRRSRSPQDIPQKIAGQPVAGRPATLRALLRGPSMKSYEFALISDQGETLVTVAMTQDAFGSFEGTVDVPSGPFRLTVTGVDDAGMRYQRSSRTPFIPQPPQQ